MAVVIVLSFQSGPTSKECFDDDGVEYRMFHLIHWLRDCASAGSGGNTPFQMYVRPTCEIFMPEKDLK